MFRFLTDRKTKLEKKLQLLLKQSYELSHSNRKLSDLKTAEAQKVREQIEAIENS